MLIHEANVAHVEEKETSWEKANKGNLFVLSKCIPFSTAWQFWTTWITSWKVPIGSLCKSFDNLLKHQQSWKPFFVWYRLNASLGPQNTKESNLQVIIYLPARIHKTHKRISPNFVLSLHVFHKTLAHHHTTVIQHLLLHNNLVLKQSEIQQHFTSQYCIKRSLVPQHASAGLVWNSTTHLINYSTEPKPPGKNRWQLYRLCETCIVEHLTFAYDCICCLVHLKYTFWT